MYFSLTEISGQFCVIKTTEVILLRRNTGWKRLQGAYGATSLAQPGQDGPAYCPAESYMYPMLGNPPFPQQDYSNE